jgi:UDP-glucose 4-epimerase
MNVLITGANGFVGKETCKLLKAKGIGVIPFDLMNGGQNISNFDSLEEVVNETKPNRILHLAATARFSDAEKNPKRCHDTNVTGTENVALVAKKYHIPVVYSSTGTVYMPIKQEMPITEEFPATIQQQMSVYGRTKRLGEEEITKYCNPWIILRYGHLYGAEKRYHGLVGGIYAKIKAGKKPQVWGGEQTNDFAYVKDVAQANYCALTATWENWNEIYNIGTGVEVSSADAARMVCEVLGYTGETEITSKRDVDPARFVYDVSKAQHMLGFKAKWQLKEGLEDMMNELKVPEGVAFAYVSHS